MVHVGKGGQSGRWQVGGPLTGDLESCLERYSHSVVDLEGSIQGNIREFLEKEKIDIVVFGALAWKGRNGGGGWLRGDGWPGGHGADC